MYGIDKILEFMKCFISGFKKPIADHNYKIFYEIIIPLHKLSNYISVGRGISECTMLYAQKDDTLGVKIIESLLKYWPVANLIKQNYFIEEISEIIPMCEIKNLEPIIERLFKRFAKILSQGSSNLNVIITQFISENMPYIITKYKNIIFPVILPIYYYLSENYYNLYFY